MKIEIEISDTIAEPLVAANALAFSRARNIALQRLNKKDDQPQLSDLDTVKKGIQDYLIGNYKRKVAQDAIKAVDSAINGNDNQG